MLLADIYYVQEIPSKYKILILLPLALVMESKKGDEHPHHPICEVCHREFNDVHVIFLSKLIM
jgi:hypothetical protein